MTLLSMLDRFEQATVTYETSTAKADRDELHAARRAIMEAFEAATQTANAPLWRPIKTAPRDGTKVRLRNDEGGTHKGTFAAPHWWMIAPGARIADGHLYTGERGPRSIMRAVEWAAIHPSLEQE